ncbi:hypothetical protein COY32_03170, partial [candidate division WWE3 bacterium CG_4_10_14_0_2_um_filter_41_14]
RAKVNATTDETARLGFSNSAASSTSFADDAVAVVMGDEQVYLANKGGVNLVSHYKLEETTTTDANQFKASGYLDTGKLNQAVSMYGNAAGTEGSTLTFNRGNQISGNNYENINTNQGTISFWVKPDWDWNDNKWHQIYRGHTSADYFSINKLDSTYNNAFKFQIYGGSGNISATNYGLGWTSGTWHHVIARWDWDNTVDGTSYIQMYIDGVATAGSASPAAGSPYAPSDIQVIGNNALSGNKPSNALIDDFAIYDRVLSTTEIADLYNSGTGREAGYVADSSLKFYAKLDGTGTLQPVT